MGFIDQDHDESIKLGLKMVKLEEINRINFDYIIIASVSMNYANKVEKNLVKYISKYKILKFSPKIINLFNIERELEHESN